LQSATFVIWREQATVNVTVNGTTYRIDTEADMIRLLAALAMLQSLAAGRAA
jgi:hypothetical protein